MLEHNGENVRAVAWSDICPWLCIFRTFRLAIGVRALFMAAAATLITIIGWSFFGRMFSVTESEKGSTAWLMPYVDSPWKEITVLVPDKPSFLTSLHQSSMSSSLNSDVQPGGQESDLSKLLSQQLRERSKQQLRERSTQYLDPVFYPFKFLNQPLSEGITQDVNLKKVICLIFCGLWSLATWAFFGAAICRIASVQLATSERVSWGSALRHACTKYVAYFSAPLIPLVGVALAALPVLVLGFIMYLGMGVFLAALIWPLLLIAGLIMTLLLLGLFFGWPLMWGTISTEGTDSFDALSRSYAYVFQRPLHYLFYAIVAAVFGWLGWLLVQNFASGIIWMTYWAASWGAGDTQITAVMQRGDLGAMGGAGAWLIHLWTGCVKLLAVGYLFSYFWTASVAIYFLLRRTVDATEMDEVFLDADEGEKTFALPKIVSDEHGAPVVSEASPAVGPDAKPRTDDLTQ
ncbi:MAG: hypothetical protein ABSA26_14615 [Thermoguttaceae bacterium]|jgi:hypothetical protein